MSDDYSDIIDLPHHVSKRHARMPMHNRAAQFAPFAALTGYESVIHEAARLTEHKTELEEFAQKRLNRSMAWIRENIARKPIVTITYFVPDKKKSGGSYEMLQDWVKDIDAAHRILIMGSKRKISLDMITEICINNEETHEENLTGPAQ